MKQGSVTQSDLGKAILAFVAVEYPGNTSMADTAVLVGTVAHESGASTAEATRRARSLCRSWAQHPSGTHVRGIQ